MASGKSDQDVDDIAQSDKDLDEPLQELDDDAQSIAADTNPRNVKVKQIKRKSSFSPGASNFSNSNQNQSKSKDNNKANNPHDITNSMDDGLDTLTADEYVRVRLIPLVSEFTKEAPALSRSVQIVTTIVIALSITSSVFASFNLTSFIPLAIAFGEALTTWQSYKTIEMKVLQTNGALQQLHKVRNYSFTNY